jgi:hypothetical protein
VEKWHEEAHVEHVHKLVGKSLVQDGLVALTLLQHLYAVLHYQIRELDVSLVRFIFITIFKRFEFDLEIFDLFYLSCSVILVIY